MKNLPKQTFSLMLTLFSVYIAACDACKLQQPEATREWTHGTGPDSDWDWFIVGIVILITVLAFYYSVKYLIRPEEKDEHHIKYTIFSDEN
ncbi:hypothetical protein [Chryseobacterium sp. CT-SW4]|uniref:hypothetical protein n=1 Tax=Chryseobacterium sp. SW-1 TaxID=3157343 RepID=UPI003B02C34E